ncbi:MAG: S8 family serine peptidase [Planctomycetota bacterium]|jgi:subtilisin family serine protease
MRKIFVLLFVVAFLGTLIAQAAPIDKIHPALRAKMLASDGGEFIPVTIRLNEQFDTYAFIERTKHLSQDERRALLIKEASRFAELRQNELLAELKQAEANGAARDTLGLWIVNMITTKIKKEAIEGFATSDAVQLISWERPIPEEAQQDVEVGSSAPADDIGWGVEKIGAPDVWALGYKGEGAVICNIDSGTDYNHPDLSDHIWNNADEIPNNGIDDDLNGFIDDTMGWDFYGDDNDPMDTGYHGTATAGIAVGDGTNGTQTGVAPEAELMICRISGEDDHMAAQQYAIENGAHACTSSYSYKWYFSPRPDYHAFRDSSVMELAAGVFHNNSSSNSGTSVGIPWNVSAPAMCPPQWLHPGQTLIGDLGGSLGIGGTESDDSHYSPSPTGPSTWEDLKIYDPGYPNSQNPAYWDYPYSVDPTGLVKVDVCCPTGGVPTTDPGGGYNWSFSGTSAATPHSGGASCLIISANPSLPQRKICQAIKMNAKDLGTPGLDTLYGAGRMDVYEAVINVLTTLLADDTNPPIGSTVTLDMEGPANAQYALLFSFNLGRTALASPRITLDIAPPYLFIQITNLDATGKDSYSFNIPPNPAHSGLDLHFQTVTDDTGGASGLFLVSLHETVSIQ